MESKLKSALGLAFVKSKGCKGGGCISEGLVYETENGHIFVKLSKSHEAEVMYKGENEGLKAIQKTNTVRVPDPMQIVDFGSKGVALVMEYIEMSGLSIYAEKLGEQLAKMHLFNLSLESNSNSVHKNNSFDSASRFVSEFGFSCATCCGSIPQQNSWKEEWVEFYAQQRLDYQMKLVETNYGDREAIELWSELNLKIPEFFKDIKVKPSLLHGDLWSGNAAETKTEPVIFDAAVFYGHSEFDLAIADMFGGFPRAFYNSYHNVIPKEPDFDRRKDLYKLFHCLNHWNHFGGGYKSSSISIMKRLLKES